MIFIYSRVSTSEQARDGAVSIPEQLRKGRAAAIAQGYSSIDIVEVVDKGVSGSVALSRRPNGSLIFEQAKRRDVVIASKLDRIFRSAQDAVNTLEIFNERGIDVILLDMGMEPIGKSAISNLFFMMLASFSNFERLLIKERTEEGRKGKRARKGFMGGQSPYGFTVVGKGRDALLTPNEQEQEIVSIVRGMSKNGHGPSRICRFLNYKNYSTRAGKQWCEMQVMRIIQKEAA